MKMMMKFANDDDDDDDKDLDDDHVENGVPISVLSNFDHPSIPFDVRKMTKQGGNVQMAKCSDVQMTTNIDGNVHNNMFFSQALFHDDDDDGEYS